ncbi:DUF2461 domain-containing protein [Sunxiuqinia sp. A32]|uniref:DUF2461 domain-containing protein n=1 Tax=Sunxiuqinia sp. A32 TaxID=3461496 RepID=UPI0040462014
MKILMNFLNELKKNNHKEWFDKNREKYQERKDQMLFLTELMIQEIGKFDSEISFIAPKDCLFRIFRDVRFSKDKTPYKTHMGSFITKTGRKGESAGYYIHIEPGNSFLGGGVWMPQADRLKAIRSEIYDNAEGFKEIINDKDFKKYFDSIHGDQLKTAPKGFPKEFEDIELLRYKSYAFGRQINDEIVLREDFVNEAVATFEQLYKANRYINAAFDKWL